MGLQTPVRAIRVLILITVGAFWWTPPELRPLIGAALGIAALIATEIYACRRMAADRLLGELEARITRRRHRAPPAGATPAADPPSAPPPPERVRS